MDIFGVFSPSFSIRWLRKITYMFKCSLCSLSLAFRQHKWFYVDTYCPFRWLHKLQKRFSSNTQEDSKYEPFLSRSHRFNTISCSFPVNVCNMTKLAAFCLLEAMHCHVHHHLRFLHWKVWVVEWNNVGRTDLDKINICYCFYCHCYFVIAIVTAKHHSCSKSLEQADKQAKRFSYD